MIGFVGSASVFVGVNIHEPYLVSLRGLGAVALCGTSIVLAHSQANLLVGHVTLTAIDPDRPASHPKRVITGIIRQKWNYQGVIITDDFVVGAIYQHNVCTAFVEALNASVDLLLVAFDGSQFYRPFGCAPDSSGQGKLDTAMLLDSEVRLKRTFWADSEPLRW